MAKYNDIYLKGIKTRYFWTGHLKLLGRALWIYLFTCINF